MSETTSHSKPGEPESRDPAETPALPPADVESLSTELEAMRLQAAENLDKFMRAKAEGENIRRRAESDVAAAHKYAIERFALEMLAVKDSLERARAVDIPAGNAALDKMLEGVELTIRLMDSIFQKFSLAEVNPVQGDKFNPEHHQAMSIQESAEVPDQHVLMALQKGYLLHGRLLRPALVIVAKAPSGAG